MRKRIPKETDNNNIHKAFLLLSNLIYKHNYEIEASLWVGAMIGLLADNYRQSDIPFHYFKEEMIEAIDHYKY